MTKDNALIHFHADGSVSVYFPPLGTGGGKAMPTNIDWDLVREALEYDLDALYVFLDSCRLSDIYVALTVIRKRRLHDLLLRIYEMALDDEYASGQKPYAQYTLLEGERQRRCSTY